MWTNIYTVVCNASYGLEQYFEIPPEVNRTAVEEFICSTNFTVLMNELLMKYDIPGLIDAIQSNQTANWTRVRSPSYLQNSQSEEVFL